MEIVNKKISELIPYKNNPRKNDNAVDKVASSIKNFGFKVPIIIDNGNEIVAGHTRLKAALKLGLEEVPCIVADDLTPAQIKAFRIADNRVSQESDWDWDKLKIELEDISSEFDYSDVGFDADDLDKLEEKKEAVEDDYEVELPDEPKAKYGDIYQLGDHRLMCGDSTKEEDVEKLMNGEKADMLFTDPPYNVNMENKSKSILKTNNYSHIENDDLSDKEYAEFLKEVFINANNSLKDDASYYVFTCQGGDNEMMMMMMRKCGIKCRHQIIWVKDAPVFSMGRLDYDYKHEPILYGWKDRHSFYRKGEQDKSVWEFSRKENKLHPTMKPVLLIVNALLNSSVEKDNVIDLFGGSGSTMIACEQLNRKCYMMEIDPKYIDVIIDRWEKLTGKVATKIND